MVPVEEQRNVVTEHVAEYLAELTSEMVTEMKTELREMVSAVDEIISPSNCDKVSNAEVPAKQKPTKGALKGDWEDSDDSQSQSESNCADPQPGGKRCFGFRKFFSSRLPAVEKII